VAKTSKASETRTIKLAGDLRIAGAAAAFGALCSAAEAAELRVALDARQVEKVDAAGLQALLAGRRALASAGKAMSCSAQLAAAARLLGLAEHLELPR
jgi:ABC-type transporter Mla MlaB component